VNKERYVVFTKVQISDSLTKLRAAARLKREIMEKDTFAISAYLKGRERNIYTQMAKTYNYYVHRLLLESEDTEMHRNGSITTKAELIAMSKRV